MKKSIKAENLRIGGEERLGVTRMMRVSDVVARLTRVGRKGNAFGQWHLFAYGRDGLGWRGGKRS